MRIEYSTVDVVIIFRVFLSMLYFRSNNALKLFEWFKRSVRREISKKYIWGFEETKGDFSGMGVLERERDLQYVR